LVSGRSIVGKLDSWSSNSICKFRKADSSTDLNTHVSTITTYNTFIQLQLIVKFISIFDKKLFS